VPVPASQHNNKQGYVLHNITYFMQSQRCLFHNEPINCKQMQGPLMVSLHNTEPWWRRTNQQKFANIWRRIALVWGNFPAEYNPRKLKKRLEQSGEQQNRAVCVWCWWVHEVFCGCFVFSVAQLLNYMAIKTDHYHKNVLFLYLLKIECTWL